MLPAPTERAPRIFGPRPGDAVGMLVCCWRCESFLTGHGLPRLRLYYGLWKKASRAELLGVEPPREGPDGGPLDACHYCGAEQDWLAFLRVVEELYRLAVEADRSRDLEQVKLSAWFASGRLCLKDPPYPPQPPGLADAVLLAETIDEVCGLDDAGFRRLMRAEMKYLRAFMGPR